MVLNFFIYQENGMCEWAWIVANEDEAARFRVTAKMHTSDKVGLHIHIHAYEWVLKKSEYTFLDYL